MRSLTLRLSLIVALLAGGCAGVRLSQPTIAPSGRSYAVAPDDAWQRIADYIAASGLGSQREDRTQGLIITDYVYERNALGLVSARFRNHYRIRLTPDGDGTRVDITVVCEEDAETNGIWRDVTAPDKAEALAGALWEVLDPILE